MLGTPQWNKARTKSRMTCENHCGLYTGWIQPAARWSHSSVGSFPLSIPMLCLRSEELNADDVMDIELDFPDLSDSALPTGGALAKHHQSQEVSLVFGSKVVCMTSSQFSSSSLNALCFAAQDEDGCDTPVKIQKTEDAAWS